MRHKYGVAPKEERTYNGKVYDSKKEMVYRKHLDFLAKASGSDKVILVEEQVPYICEVNKRKICKYLLDFRVTYADNRVEHIDVKGFKTTEYKLKKKLVEALYAFEIIEK